MVMFEIPKEAYYVIGTIVVTKFDVILRFFNSRVDVAVRDKLLESSIQNLTIEIGKLTQQQEKLQKDVNVLFQKSRDVK